MKLVILALAALLPLTVAAQAQTLTERQIAAAYAAVDDEYHAQGFYQAVIVKLGPIKPFSNIVGAEQTHADRVIAVLTAAGVAIPVNPYADGSKPLPEVPATKSEACAIGVQAELANSGLYDGQLLPAVVGNADLTAAFIALRDASQTKHLPAFQRCAK